MKLLNLGKLDDLVDEIEQAIENVLQSLSLWDKEIGKSCYRGCKENPCREFDKIFLTSSK